MTFILGISAFYHDSAAALLRDGEIVAAVQEERFSRKKYDASFPTHAIEFCLAEANIGPEQLDYVAFYEQPLTKFERLIETYVSYAPLGFASFRRAIPLWLREKLHLPQVIRSGLDGHYTGRILFPGHHESHAASAFFPSPYEEAAILTLDAVGEWSTTTIGHGRGNRIDLLQEIRFPHSLGLLYSAFTYYCGFKVNSGEYKLMGLAPYGEPRFVDLIYRHLIDLKPDGSYHMDLSYFRYCQGLTMTSPKFHDLFGGPPRRPDSPLVQRHMDLAASIQKVCEEIMLRSAHHAWDLTGKPKHLVMAGGVALNCVANGRVLREGPFEKIWIQPAAGDAGGGLGAALFVWHHLLGKPRHGFGKDIQKASLLGPSYSNAQVRECLEEFGARYRRFDDEDALLHHVATAMSEGRVVGWFHGRAEFGPRALGARSIIADPRNPGIQSALNLKIKFRETFRPFAPCVLREHVHEWFEMRPGEDSPYMLLVAPVLEKHRVALTREEAECLKRDPDLSRRVNIVRSAVPAITHVDYSARVQTVDERHGRFYRLMKTFHEKTGCPIIVNTSFNLSREPMVLTPKEAYYTFMQSEMDVLAIEDFVLHKYEQPSGLRQWGTPERTSCRDKAGQGKNHYHHAGTTGGGVDMINPEFSEGIPPVAASITTLRQFAGLCLGIFLILFAWSWFSHDGKPTVAAWISAALAVAVGLPGLVHPPLVRPVFLGAMAITQPIGHAISTVTLGLIYFSFLTLLAVVFRLAGRDVLVRRQPFVASYWVPKLRATGLGRYLRQYQR